MSGDEKKPPTLEEQVQESMKKASMSGGIMGQAMKMTNMAYAFQFAQMAVPKLKIVEGQALDATLRAIHDEEKGLIVSVCSENDTPNTYVVVYYAMEK